MESHNPATFQSPPPGLQLSSSKISCDATYVYPLVMTFTVRHGKIHPFLIGKPSISMGHLYHGYVSHNQMVTYGKSQFFNRTMIYKSWITGG